MRVGVIGAGMFGSLSMGRFKNMGAEVVSVADVAIDRARAAADAFGIAHVTDDVSQLVGRDDIDLVHVVVPPNHLYEVVSAVIAAGKNVLCEKPLTTSAEEARKLVAEVQAARVIHAVDHEMRYDPVHCYVRNLVKEGFIGRPRVFTVREFTRYAKDPRYPTYYATWTAYREQGGGFSQQHLVHILDLAQSIVGFLDGGSGRSITYVPQRPVLAPSVTLVELFQLGENAPTTGMAEVDGDDVATVVGQTPDGVLISVVAGWTVHHPAGLAWELYGDEGTLSLTSAGELYGAGKGSEMQRLVCPAEYDLPGDPGLTERTGLGVMAGQHMGFMFEALARDLAGAVSGEPGDRVYCTFDQALVTRAILDGLDQVVVPAESPR